MIVKSLLLNYVEGLGLEISLQVQVGPREARWHGAVSRAEHGGSSQSWDLEIKQSMLLPLPKTWTKLTC